MSRNGHHAASDQLEKDIVAERAALRRALDSLNNSGTADTLARDVLRLAGIRDDDLARIAVRTVRDNPAASAITGAGLAWLIYRAASTPSHTAPRSLLDDTVDTLRAALKEGRAQASDTLRDTYDDAKSTAAKAAKDASRTAQQGVSDLADTARDHPLATTAVALAAAAGLAGIAGRSMRQSQRPHSTLDNLREENQQLRQLIAEALGSRH